MKRSGYSRPHTIHCGPDAIYVSALGADNGGEGPGGIFMLDHFNFDVLGPWEIDRGPQQLAYDFWWHITEDTMITSATQKIGTNLTSRLLSGFGRVSRPARIR